MAKMRKTRGLLTVSRGIIAKRVFSGSVLVYLACREGEKEKNINV